MLAIKGIREDASRARSDKEAVRDELEDAANRVSEVKSHLGSHLLTPESILYTQQTNRHHEVASSNTMGAGDGCKYKLDL
jgi:hypothetical protein